MKSNRVLGMAIILLGFANLVLITTRPVNRILSWCFALPGIVLFILASIMYAKEGKASVYSDWDKGFERDQTVIDEPQQPIGAYGKSFHSLNIRELVGNMKDEKCPRCGNILWGKIQAYENRGRAVVLWKCGICDYEEERFA